MPKQIVYLTTSDTNKVRIWETDPARAEMKAWILALPNSAAMWAKFLQEDQQIADTLLQESQAAHIKVFGATSRPNARHRARLSRTISASRSGGAMLALSLDKESGFNGKQDDMMQTEPEPKPPRAHWLLQFFGNFRFIMVLAVVGTCVGSAVLLVVGTIDVFASIWDAVIGY